MSAAHLAVVSRSRVVNTGRRLPHWIRPYTLDSRRNLIPDSHIVLARSTLVPQFLPELLTLSDISNLTGLAITRSPFVWRLPVLGTISIQLWETFHLGSRPSGCSQVSRSPPLNSISAFEGASCSSGAPELMAGEFGRFRIVYVLQDDWRIRLAYNLIP